MTVANKKRAVAVSIKSMLSFSYTTSLQLRDLLGQIDRLRTQILTLPLSQKTEAKLAWEAAAIRTWATLSLAGIDIPKHEVATILANATKKNPGTALIYAQRTSYNWIHETWRANAKPVTISTLESLYYLLFGEKRASRENFAGIEKSLRELLQYLDAKQEHPAIQSAIVHIQLLTRPPDLVPEWDEHGLFARAASYLFLSKYGYDIRGWIMPERVWLAVPATYRHLQDQYRKSENLTMWLEYIAESMVTNLTAIARDIEESAFHIEFPASFWNLTDRQKDILHALEEPNAKITNRMAQQKFRISQITASRDLAKLTSMGLLYPHGKGRSVYYTKI